MLKFFRSAPKPPAPEPEPEIRPETTSRPASRSAAAGLPPAPPPLPEVQEGNEDSDWAMWEDSVSFQDSQMPSTFGDLDSVRTRDEPAKKPKDVDPFATVRRRGS